MTIAFLNDQFLPLEEARISPMDRGFLFGDGIYEVIPTLHGKAVGMNAHLDRLQNGLDELAITNPKTKAQWTELVSELVTKNTRALNSASVGVYIQVSRGTEMKRAHGYPDNIPPTVFAFAFATAAPPVPDKAAVVTFDVASGEDKRWQRCNIKSTSLLGNVMHYQQGRQAGKQEIILLNSRREVTEASSCNVFVVKDGIIMTPPLDHQILPGITRKLVIESLAAEGVEVQEVPVTAEVLFSADEVWLTSSSKEISPVTSVDDKPVGNGQAGEVWLKAITAFNKHKFTL